VKFSPAKEIASKNASADFQNFCRLASKIGAESVVFFGLEGTLPYIRNKPDEMWSQIRFWFKENFY